MFLCLYFHAYFILSHKWEKSITKKNKRLNRWSLLINWTIQFLIWADWIIKIDLCQILCVALEFLSNGEGLHCSSWPNILPKLSKITDLSKESKHEWLGSILTFLKSAKSISILNCSKSNRPAWKVIEKSLRS